MNGKFLRVVFFNAVIIGCAFSCNAALISGLAMRKTGEFGVWNQIVKGGLSADCLIVGASRALVNFDPSLMERQAPDLSFFNIGLDGSGPGLSRARLYTYLKYNKAPRLIVLSVDIVSLERPKGVYQAYQYAPYLKEEVIYKELLRIDRFFWKQRYIPLSNFFIYGWGLVKSSLIGYREHFCGIPEKDNTYIKGYYAVDRFWQNDFTEYKAQYPDGKKFLIDDGMVDALKGMLKTARSRGIDIIIVYSPEYYENFALTVNRDEIFAIFKALARQYDAPFWDYSDSPLCMSTAFFYNSQHLNIDGTRRFSAILGARLAEYLRAFPKGLISDAKRIEYEQ